MLDYIWALEMTGEAHLLFLQPGKRSLDMRQELDSENKKE